MSDKATSSEGRILTVECPDKDRAQTPEHKEAVRRLWSQMMDMAGKENIYDAWVAVTCVRNSLGQMMEMMEGSDGEITIRVI